MTTTPFQGQTCTPFGIEPRLGVATLRAQVAFRKDSRPQAILKFHCPGSLDYKARHGLLVFRQYFQACFEIFIVVVVYTWTKCCKMVFWVLKYQT